MTIYIHTHNFKRKKIEWDKSKVQAQKPPHQTKK